MYNLFKRRAGFGCCKPTSLKTQKKRSVCQADCKPPGTKLSVQKKKKKFCNTKQPVIFFFCFLSFKQKWKLFWDLGFVVCASVKIHFEDRKFSTEEKVFYSQVESKHLKFI